MFASLEGRIVKVYLTEFIGTFFLALTIGLAVISGTPFAPLVIGAGLMVMVYMGGHVSGAHYNPAVTLAVCLRGRLPAARVAPYWASQVLGALSAAFVTRVMTGHSIAPSPAPGATLLQVMLAEILFTFALVLVVLNVATAKATEGNSYYGLAIGSTVMVGAYAAGPISGGGLNPAVGIGLTVVATLFGDAALGHLWHYLVGPMAGGALAVLAFRVQHAGAAA
jgi:aquaporin Z